MSGNVLSVSQIIKYLKDKFSNDEVLSGVSVIGEVSGVKYHTNGNIYFTLKENKENTLSCTMLSWHKARGLKFELEDGQQVVCYGPIIANGWMSKYEMNPFSISLAGKGQVNEEFEKLKLELEEKGYFSDIYKKTIPEFAKKVGVVTSATGAAIVDIVREAKDRNPYVQLYLYPALVQGERSAASIAKGIKELDNYGVDVIIVGRGGGGKDELWAFNERIVAEAIFNCNTPVISAVGHEVDFTIADLVADIRVKTPTAAAALAVFDYEDFCMKLEDTKRQLCRIMDNKISINKVRLENAVLKIEKIDPKQKLKMKKEDLSKNKEILENLMRGMLIDRKHSFEMKRQSMIALSPLSKLTSGYVYASKDDKPIKSVDEITPGDNVVLNLRDGQVYANVTDVNKEDVFA